VASDIALFAQVLGDDNLIDLVPARRRMRLNCEARVDSHLVMDGEAWAAMPNS
jgi:hypothetical protein